jgi:hypothetical protein
MNQNKKGGRESRFFKDLKKKALFLFIWKSENFEPVAGLCTPYCDKNNHIIIDESSWLVGWFVGSLVSARGPSLH